MRGNSRIDSYKIARGGILLKVSRTPTVGPKSAPCMSWGRVTQMVPENFTMRGRWPRDILDGVCRQNAVNFDTWYLARCLCTSVRIGVFAHTQKDHSVCLAPTTVSASLCVSTLRCTLVFPPTYARTRTLGGLGGEPPHVCLPLLWCSDLWRWGQDCVCADCVCAGV